MSLPTYEEGKTLKVNEYFQSMQGEGFYTGTPSFFVRLQGCDVGCTFCDTKYTWSMKSRVVPHYDLQPDSAPYALMTTKEILDICEHTKHIVVTGGEPTLQELLPLTTLAIESGKSIQIETSGTERIRVHPDTWVTLSPKFMNPGKKPLIAQCVRRANEFKFPIDDLTDLYVIDQFLEEHEIGDRLVWLQPISQGEEATKVCLSQARIRGWRISIQTHKYLGLR